MVPIQRNAGCGHDPDGGGGTCRSLGRASGEPCVGAIRHHDDRVQQFLGENSIAYFERLGPRAILVFRVAVLTMIAWASVQDLGTVFGFADLTMALLALTNLLALWALYPVAQSSSRILSRKWTRGSRRGSAAISCRARR